MSDWPAGCRILFTTINPATNQFTIEDVFEARSFHLSDGELRIYSDSGQLLRLLPFTSVLIIAPLITVGPASAPN